MVIADLIPPKYRIAVLAWACAGTLTLMFIGVPVIGRVAWSSETQRIDAVVQQTVAATASNTTLIEKQIQVQAALSADVNDLMLAVISGRIRSAIAARCRLPSSERARLTEEIENQQQLYVKRTDGVRAYEPRCNEL
jgi:hypothetical protein